MTVINTIRHPNAVHVITDGAATSPADQVVFNASKVYLMPQISAVLALRGPYMLTAMIAAQLQSLALSYDHFRAIVVMETAHIFGQQVDAWRTVFPDPQVELVVAGFSESAGADKLAMEHAL
jgi:hypothetical protein